ncbi:MAG: FtsH protease activity modulator HflK [Oceanospirillales bacterium]|uniref:Protein HflK n=1 Tax=Marinobacterium halophilum TaxID=267374 RepID=A0A2P8F3L8_9GAMM|nr:FtsH protease activity modulator HflK [Marinobacterium halophilum]MBR9829261.1 FtsH protease activity modulator HflK [Oceanospirillales bacterium]PSL16314.1 protease FtsH subunit HflK [Marinobacterium halophilum]
MAWNEPGGNGNNHDPWSGGGDNRGKRGGGNDQGPPDLDEAMRKLQDRLGGIFGGGKKRGGSGGGGSSAGGGSGFIVVLIVLAALFWAGMGFYTIDQQERGIVLRLGKYHDTVQPGLQWNPPLVDDVTKVNTTRIRSYDHRSLMLTADENIVDVDMTVQYVVSDPMMFALKVRDPSDSLAQSSESALRHVVGTSEMHSILTEGRDTLALEVQARLQRYMESYTTGISISKVNIKNAQAPRQVQDAFDDVIKAREDEQRAKNEAEAYANGIVPEARGRAQRLQEESNAYREEVVAKATGEASRFKALLTEYQKAPVVTRERLYIDTLQDVLGRTGKVIVDVDGGNNMMYLPLDRLTAKQPVSDGSARGMRLDEDTMRQIADQVIEETRQRSQTTSGLREGR